MLVRPGLPQRYVASTHLPCNKACQAQERGRGAGGGGEEKEEESLSFPPRSPLPFSVESCHDWLISRQFMRWIALSTRQTSTQWISGIETNYVIHLIQVSWIALPTFQTTGPRPGKERCSKAKSPVKGNNLTPRLEYGPLNVMFQVLPRYQSLRLYFCISNVMHNRYKYA